MSKLFICFVLFLPLISAIQITEVELNPVGTDAGNEWIEFYSSKETNLSNYKLKNNDGDELIINGTFQGYFIYFFQNQWLDNTDEIIFFYNGSKLIQKTELFEDKDNDKKTYQLCNGEWIFQEQTRNKINCEETIQKKENKTNITLEQENNEQKENFFERREKLAQNFSKSVENTTKEIIYLNPKTIKKEKTNSLLEEKNYAKYSIIVFCILLFFLYLIKSRKKKNEWQ
jgi:lipopolysaccharide export LptBFGC system permease protein LptF